MFPKRKHLANCKNVTAPLFVVPSVYTTKPNTDKETDLFSSDSLVVAVTSMQGWREEMEDAYCVLLPRDSALDRHALALRRWRDERRSERHNGNPDLKDPVVGPLQCGCDCGEMGAVHDLSSSSISSSLLVPNHGATPNKASGPFPSTPFTPAPTPSFPALPSPALSPPLSTMGSSAPVFSESPSPSFYSQGHGAVRFGTSIDVGSHHIKHKTPSVTTGLVAAGPLKGTSRLTICGVFDGHGGASVAEEVAKEIPRAICSSQAIASNGLYERGLYDTFVESDVKMQERWNRCREWYGCAGCTANVVMIVEELSSEITTELEQQWRSQQRSKGDVSGSHAHFGGSLRSRSPSASPTSAFACMGQSPQQVFGAQPEEIAARAKASSPGVFGATPRPTYTSASTPLVSPPLLFSATPTEGVPAFNKDTSTTSVTEAVTTTQTARCTPATCVSVEHNVAASVFASSPAPFASTAPFATSLDTPSAEGPRPPLSLFKDPIMMGAVANSSNTTTTIASDSIKIICANAGDARAVLVRANGLVVALSSDHKPSCPAEKHRILSAKGTVQTSYGIDRIGGILAVSRGFGDFMFKGDSRLAIDKQLVIPNPDIRSTFQKKDVKGRYAFPWLDFEESQVGYNYCEKLIKRANEGSRIGKRIQPQQQQGGNNNNSNNSTSRAGAHAMIYRTPPEREVVSLQRCLQWVPSTQRLSPPPGAATRAPSRSTNVHPQAAPQPANLLAPPCTAENPVPSSTPTPMASSPHQSHPQGEAGPGQFPLSQSLPSSSVLDELAATDRGGVEAAKEAEEAEVNVPAPALCDPSAVGCSLFVAIACDGIWDCLSNRAMADLVIEMLDAQINPIITAVMREEEEYSRGRNVPDESETRTPPTQQQRAPPRISSFESLEGDVPREVSELTNGKKESPNVSSGQEEKNEQKNNESKRKAELDLFLRNIADKLNFAQVTERVVQHCLECSFVSPSEKPGSPPVCGCPGLCADKKLSLSVNSERTCDSPYKNKTKSEQKAYGQDASCRGACVQPEGDGAQTPCAATKAVSQEIPKRPLNPNGTDNMTFMLVFFKEGLSTRAMLLLGKAEARKRNMERKERAVVGSNGLDKSTDGSPPIPTSMEGTQSTAGLSHPKTNAGEVST